MKKIFTFIAAVCFAGSMMAANLLEIDFKAGQGEWAIDVKANPDNLEAIWVQDAKYGMKASAYTNNDKVNHPAEAWLISPTIDLSGVTAATLSLSQAVNFANGHMDYLSVLASEDGENWSALSLSEWPAGNSWTFINSTADLTAFAGKPGVKIAFKYTSTADASPTWEISSVVISDGGEPQEGADVTFTGADFTGQGTSSTGSEVKATKDGVTFVCDKAYSDDQYSTLRCYKNGVITITSETEQIGKLVFQFYSTYTGDLDNEVVVNAKEWSYTLTNQARIEKLEIYFGEYQPIVITVDTIDVTEAVEIAKKLTPEKGKSASTEKKYAVRGYIVGASSKYENTWYMADEVGAYGEFQAYKCASVDAEVAEGDFVIVTGKIMHYYGESSSGEEYHNYEISGGDLVHGEAPQGIENVVLTEKAQKVIVDGVLYIIRDNKMYNIQGLQVR